MALPLFCRKAEIGCRGRVRQRRGRSRQGCSKARHGAAGARQGTGRCGRLRQAVAGHGEMRQGHGIKKKRGAALTKRQGSDPQRVEGGGQLGKKRKRGLSSGGDGKGSMGLLAGVL